MQFVMNVLQRWMKHHVDRYEGVLALLEESFGRYETGQISINAYLDAVGTLDQRVRAGRPLWLQLCDWSLAMRWINAAERRAFRETCDALDWCRNWAVRQRGVDVVTCIESARANVESGFVPGFGVAA